MHQAHRSVAIVAASLSLWTCRATMHAPVACESNSDCTAPLVCDLNLGQCTPPCESHSDCDSDRVCNVAGVCVPFPQTCDAAAECGPGAYCDDGSCRKALTRGAACTEHLPCGDGFCADGVCCDGLCEGACVSCRREWTGARLGQCAPILQGTDPGDHCAGQLACDGAGSCYAGAGGDACGADYECAAGVCELEECTLCGDGVVSGNEECDDGNTVDDGNGCDGECRGNNVCGNGVWEDAVEGCDDGNLEDGDGCSAQCEVEPGFACRGSPSICGVVIRVWASSTAADPDGLTWDDAYPSLGQALDVLAPYEDNFYEIWVAKGVYTPGSTRGSAFYLHGKLAIYGGFAGTENVREERDWQAYPTVLSGDLDDNDAFSVFTDNAFHVVRAGPEAGVSAVLDGFIIRAGRDIDPQGGNATGSGAGIYIHGGSPTLSHLRVEDNRADNGAGLHVQSGSPVLRHVEFRDNFSNEHGGAAWLAASVELHDVRFNNNIAFGEGGGVYVSAGTITLNEVSFERNEAYHGGGLSASLGLIQCTACVFEHNMAVDLGGGIYHDTHQASFYEAAEFRHNWALKGGGGMHIARGSPQVGGGWFEGNQAWQGGAVQVALGTPAIERSVFFDNSARNLWMGSGETDGGGGGALHTQAAIVVKHCTFVENRAGISPAWGQQANGGAVFAEGNVDIWNGLFIRNAARRGGALAGGDSATIRLYNATLYGNHALVEGGGAYAGQLTLVYNSILWQNSASDGDAEIAEADGSIVSVEYTIITGGFPGDGNLDEDPLFVDTATGNFRLQALSPAIDTGHNGHLPTGLTVDLDGNARIFNEDNEGIVDRGAYEWHPNGGE